MRENSTVWTEGSIFPEFSVHLIEFSLIEGCDCKYRIEELERLLAESRGMLEILNEEKRRDEERKAKMKKAVEKQVFKTKKILKSTENTIPEQV